MSEPEWRRWLETFDAEIVVESSSIPVLISAGKFLGDVNSEALDSQLRVFAFNEAIPHLSSSLIKLSCGSPEVAELAIGLCNIMIALYAESFRAKDGLDRDKAIISLYSLLAPNQPLYTKHPHIRGIEPSSVLGESPIAKDKCAGLNCTEIMENQLNIFGSRGGFESLVGVLGDSMNIFLVRNILKLVLMLSPYLVMDVLKSFVTEVYAQVVNKVLGLSEKDLHATQKDLLYDVVSTLGSLMEKGLIDTPMHQILQRNDQFRLALSAKLFKCPFLDKRMAGLQVIKHFLVSRVQDDSYGEEDYLALIHSSQPNNLPASFMISWLASNDIIETLVSPSGLHPEVVRRAVEIPRFLANHDAFTDVHAQLLWDATVEKHESVTSAVYGLIADLAPSLSEHCLQFFDKCIQSKGQGRLPTLSRTDIEFLSRFTRHYHTCLYHWNLSVNTNGPAMLYSLAIDSQVSADTAEYALGLLIDLIRGDWWTTLRDKVMITCARELENRHAVPQILLLLRNTLECLLHTNHAGRSQSDEIEEYQRRYDLVKLFFNDLMHFKEESKAEKNSFVGDDVSLMPLPDSHYSYGTALNIRVEFLGFFLNSSRTSFSKHYAEKFWDYVISDAFSSKEISLGLGWLEKVFISTNTAEEVLCFILNEKFPQLNMSELCISGFHLLQYLILSVNSNCIERSQNKILSVKNCNIAGLDTLWKVAIQARVDLVQREAIDFIVTLQKALDLELVSMERERLIQFCMLELNSCSSSTGGTDIQQTISYGRVQQSLRLLKALMDEFDSSSIMGQRHGLRIRGQQLVLRIIPVNGEKFELEMMDHELLGDLRRKIAEHCKWTPQQVRLIRSGRELKEDESTLQALHISGSVHVTRRAVQLPDGSFSNVHSIPVSSPMQVSGSHFDIILHLTVSLRAKRPAHHVLKF